MHSHKGMLSATALTLTTALALGSPAIAADRPKSGSIKVHSGWKSVGEVVTSELMSPFAGGEFCALGVRVASRPRGNGTAKSNHLSSSSESDELSPWSMAKP